MNVSLECVRAGYDHGPDILHTVSCSFAPGKLTGLLGPNGCGKSTLLRCINGNLPVRHGHVLLDRNPVARLSHLDRARSVAVVTQDTPANLPFSALATVLLGRHPHALHQRHDSPDDLRIARECLERVDAAHLADRRFDRLSGGERRRVIVARALAQQTPILLLDEATAHLDLAHQLALFQLSRALAREGRTIVMVCHDLLLAPLFLDDCLLMRAGQIVAAGEPAATLSPERLREVFGTELAIRWVAGNSVEARLAAPAPQGA